MKKTLPIALLALFVSLTSFVFAQANAINLNELVAAIEETPEDTASLVEEAVRNSPEQAYEITERLLATFPDLAEEIIYGAIAGMPEPLSEEDIEQYLLQTVSFRPALAPDIVIGARRATTPAMEPVITSTVRLALQQIISQDGLGVLGRTSRSSVPGEDNYDPTIHQIISPSQNPATN